MIEDAMTDEKRGGTCGITVMPEGKVIFYSPGEDLLSLLSKEGVFVDGACGGAGTCGKCKVAILSGDLPPPSGNERDLLSEEERLGRCRLACRIVPAGDIVVEVPAPQREFAIPASETPPDSRLKPGLYGLAVDIGTTTVEAALTDMRTGREVAVRSAINPQTRFGMDVLSRISYVMARPDGVDTLQRAIVELLDSMAGELCPEPSSIAAVAVAANCAMLHLLLGVSPAPLGAFPFRPAFVEGRDLPAAEIGLKNVGKGARLYCLPSVSAFIGADIVAGLYASGLTRQKGNVLFIDIGTNGEMALFREGPIREGPQGSLQEASLVSCSCAAGPALEGMNIRCGMRAAVGAVEDVFIDADGSVRLKIIGAGASETGTPVGICGSGILAAVREFLRVGLVRPDGALATAEELPLGRRSLAALCREENGNLAVRLSEKVIVTQKDIRQVQLAKGALLSGVCALLDWWGLQARDLDKVFVAGQFGAHLPAESLTGCGILPAELQGKIEYLGNSSRIGARKALTSSSVREEMEALARSVACLELGATPGYEELFMRCLEFPPGNREDPSADRP
ncbi:MAG: ASKHA domain-containing protein [Synergistaceae bacterium]|jgi:uncharacterized 2Fe-2S/4Fe-4S cluster protein (DUF4445 family)|nr:ASKHA domain-containing protein [Synergistaceae bacterium]